MRKVIQLGLTDFKSKILLTSLNNDFKEVILWVCPQNLLLDN